MASPLPVRVKGDSNIHLTALVATIRSLPAIVSPRLVNRIAYTYKSIRGEEYFVHVNAVPKARKWTEERAGGVVATIKQTITNDTYEISMAISGDDWSDDQIGLYAPLAKEVMARLVLAPDELIVTDLINNGESLSAFDGQYFYATGHVWPNGEYTTGQSNLYTGTGVTAEAIHADFFGALAVMQAWKDDRGAPKMFQQAFENPENVVVHHAVGLNAAMNAVFGSAKNGEPFSMEIGSAGAFRKSQASGMASRIPDAHLSGNDWYMHFTGGPMEAQRPFVFLDREAANVTILGKGSEHYDKYNEVLILGKRRFGLGMLRPECSQKIDN